MQNLNNKKYPVAGKKKKMEENKIINEETKTEKTAKGGQMSKRTRKAITITATALLTVAVFFAGYFTKYFSIHEIARSLDFILNIYDKHYCSVDGETPSSVEITKTLANAFIGDYADRYSEYFSPEDKTADDKESNGERLGVGIAFLSDFTVYSVSGNSPAEHAGIKAGGKVTAFKSGTSDVWTAATTENDGFNGFKSFLNGIGSGDTVCLKIEYSGGEAFEYEMAKKAYNQTFVYYADQSGYYGYGDQSGEMQLNKTDRVTSLDGVALSEIDEKTGYIRLTQFSGLKSGLYGGAGQFAGALNKFKSQNRKNLILDLRGNGGGFVSILAEIAPYLCPYDGGKSACMVAVDKNGGRDVTKTSSKSKYGDYDFEKIVILADDGSASASEALIGAVLDYDKSSGKNAVTVILSPSVSKIDGVAVTEYKTYGKGIMQTTYTNVLTGEAFKLTTAVIRWPVSDICIHGVGVTSALNQKLGRTAVLDGGFNGKGDFASALNALK